MTLKRPKCNKCNLGKSKRVVLPRGNKEADIVLIGEAPGKREDKKGKAFVGKSGKLLDKTLSEVNLSEEDVYITNLVKCRPPDNRDPKKKEIRACLKSEYSLEREVEEYNFDKMVTLGRIPTQAVLGFNTKISSVIGESYNVKGMELIPCYHPAATFYGEERLDKFKEVIHSLGEEDDGHKQETLI